MPFQPFNCGIQWPGTLDALSSFTYRPLDNTTCGGHSDREVDLCPITTFLTSNCPNLQHLRVKIFPSPNQDLTLVEFYAVFIKILDAKPNLETPKTFLALDLPGLQKSGWGATRCEEQLGKVLVGWERVGLGQYRSSVSKHSKRPLV